MWDLSSPTRDQTLASHIESVESLTAGPLGKSLYGNFKNRFIEMKFMCHVVHPFKVQNLIVFRIFAGEGNGNPLHYSFLENPMDRGAWWAAVHGVAKSWTRLSDFTFTFHFHALEKEMATHSSVLAWRIPGMGEPGGLLSLGSHRVGHD